MKKLTDPYGISLLDLLSNALGAVILLFLVVAVGSRGSQDKETKGTDEMGTGKTFSNQKAHVGKVKDTTTFTVEVAMYGGIGQLKINSNDSIWRCFRSEAEFDIHDKNSPQDAWLIKQERPLPAKPSSPLLSVTLDTIKGFKLCDSVQLTIFKSNDLVNDKLGFFKVQKDAVQTIMIEDIDGDGKIFGQPYYR